MKEEIRKKLNKVFASSDISFDVRLSAYTSFRLGGEADVFFKPKNNEEVKSMVDFCQKQGLDYFVLGRGSNVLIGDKGYKGVVIYFGDNFSKCKVDDAKVYAQAGISLWKMADIILDNSLKGFEFASGIPGSLGGAIYMNAGAYGGEIKDSLESVTALMKTGEIRTFLKKDLEFGYRNTKLMSLNAIVLDAVFVFEKGDKNEIKALMQDLNSRRKTKQPLEFPSAGSTFKRPTGYYAGKLIMDSGLAGYRVGGVSVSKKHCGFVVNDNGGTSADVVQIINDIKDRVYENFGVELECEVRFIGEF